MYKNKSIAAVIPCYNEETQISRVVTTMPEFIDYLIIIDDLSTDKTLEMVRKLQLHEKRIELIAHTENQGVGGAIASGYIWCRDNDVDVAVVMAGDGQMFPEDLPVILDPVVKNEVDYTKGNRLRSGEAFQKIPKIRYIGNSTLSLLTKISSGYWHIADSQSGYTAINKGALRVIDWNKMYKRYGQPNDLLISLNIYNFRVRDILIEPVYGIGEKSNIKVRRVMFTIGWLILKGFFRRMKDKYIIRDFHPLVFFYFLGISFGLLTIFLFIRLFVVWYLVGHIPSINALAAMFSFVSANLFILFAMWFDMEANKHLR